MEENNEKKEQVTPEENTASKDAASMEDDNNTAAQGKTTMEENNKEKENWQIEMDKDDDEDKGVEEKEFCEALNVEASAVTTKSDTSDKARMTGVEIFLVILAGVKLAVVLAKLAKFLYKKYKKRRKKNKGILIQVSDTSRKITITKARRTRTKTLVLEITGDKTTSIEKWKEVVTVEFQDNTTIVTMDPSDDGKLSNGESAQEIFENILDAVMGLASALS